MTTQREVERVLDSFFAPNGDEVADWVIDAALSEVEHTPQRRVIDVPWRPRQMNPFARLAVAAAAIVIVAGGALYLFTPGNQGIGGPPAASPSPFDVAPSAAPSSSPSGSVAPATPQPLTWETFTSDRFGYRMEVPVGWLHTNPVDDLPDDLFPGAEAQYADRWDQPVLRFPYLIVAVIDPAPQAAADWLDRAVAGLVNECGGSDPVSVSVAGTTGERRSAVCMAGMSTEVAHFTDGNRVYTIESSATANDAATGQAILDHVLETFELIDRP